MKKILKSALFNIAFLHSVFYIALFKILKIRYSAVATMMATIPGRYGMYVRENYYKHTLAKCGKNLQVGYGAFIVYSDVEIGDNCAIEEYAIVSKCTIGNDVIISARCSIMSGGNHHDVDDIETPFRYSFAEFRRVILGDNLWIGTHAVIMNDVSSHTVVGAGAVVTKVFEPYSVIAGVPAKFIRKRGKNADANMS
ncbi:MAG TPA: acyltransferase [Campylobacterales bacterium]|nr:acyltransferase [Campylobacterales bacterium]